jgi:hypothetical protein
MNKKLFPKPAVKVLFGFGTRDVFLNVVLAGEIKIKNYFFKYRNWPSLRAQDNLRCQKSFGPLEMPHCVVCLQKNIVSRIFKISGYFKVSKSNSIEKYNYKKI